MKVPKSFFFQFLISCQFRRLPHSRNMVTCVLVRLFVTSRVTNDGHVTRLGTHNLSHPRLFTLVAVLVQMDDEWTLPRLVCTFTDRISRR